MEQFSSGWKRSYYGKGDVTVYRLNRDGKSPAGGSPVFGANILMLLYGDAFWPTYTTGDNTGLIATDSMKNFIQREALNWTGSDLEDCCRFLGEKFLVLYPQVEGVQVSAVEIPYAPKNAFVTFMLEQFGRPQRNSGVQCDCERDPNASVMQVLSLANHPRLRQKIADDKGQIARILKSEPDKAKRIDEVFLVTLCRPPTDAERQACSSYVRESASEAEGLRGVMWSLLNTREFLLAH